MTNTRIFKIKNTVHEEYFIIEKNLEEIIVKRYIYGVLLHQDSHDIKALHKLDTNNVYLTLEEICKVPYSVAAQNSVFKDIRYFFELNERLWNSFFQKLEKIIKENLDVSDKAFYFDAIGIVERTETGEFEGKRITKGFDCIVDLYVDSEISDINLNNTNQCLLNILENLNNHKEEILFNLKNRENVKSRYEEWKDEFEDTSIVGSENTYHFEKYITFKNIAFYKNYTRIYANVPWDEEHGIELEFDNEGNYIFNEV